MAYKILDSRDIDQNYDFKSSNPQSGKAVAEAISTKANLQFKEIDNIDVTLFDGNSFKKPDIYTVLSTKVIESGAVEITFSNAFNLWCDTEGIFKEGCHYLIDAHLTEDSGDGITHWRTNYFAEVIDLEDKVNVADIDQSFNPESENAQSGKAVAEAVTKATDWITLADITLDETNGEVTSIAHKGIDGQILQKCKELMMIAEMDAVNEYKSSQMYLRVSLYGHYQMPIMYAISSAITANTKVRALSRVLIGDMGALALSSNLSSHELFNSMTTNCNTMVAFGSNEYDSSPVLYINLEFSSLATATQNFGAGAHLKLIGRVS